MKKRQDILSLCIIVVLYLILELILGITCPILFLTGVSCAGCGMSRAWFCVFQMDFERAFYYHPLFWMIPIMGIAFLCWNKIPAKIQRILLATAVILFLVVYIWRMVDITESVVVFRPGKGAIISVISNLLTKR